MAKNVQIPEELYQLLVEYHLNGNQSVSEQIYRMLIDKEERRKRRNLYQMMQDTSMPDEVREIAKDLYQDSLGVPPEFRN